MKTYFPVAVLLALLFHVPVVASGEPLPFETEVESYRFEEGDVMAFTLRLEQPFLAEEFEKSNKLRLRSLHANDWLIYSKETQFERKRAEFHGRLRGEESAKLELSYEVVTEDLAGEPEVDIRTRRIEIPIATEPTGIDAISKQWARRQNTDFPELPRYYPETSVLKYVMLQSKARYGVDPPPIFKAARHQKEAEGDRLVPSLQRWAALAAITCVGGAARREDAGRLDDAYQPAPAAPDSVA